MHIIQATIKNFKGLGGLQSIEFDNKMTLIIGRNGAGKSSILEAILFALTGEGKENAPHIENDIPQPGFVQLIIEHEGKTYTLKRSWTISKNGQQRVTVEMHTPEGKVWTKQTEVLAEIARMLGQSEKKVKETISKMFVVKQGGDTIITVPGHVLLDLFGIVPVNADVLKNRIETTIRSLQKEYKGLKGKYEILEKNLSSVGISEVNTNIIKELKEYKALLEKQLQQATLIELDKQRRELRQKLAEIERKLHGVDQELLKLSDDQIRRALRIKRTKYVSGMEYPVTREDAAILANLPDFPLSVEEAKKIIELYPLRAEIIKRINNLQAQIKSAIAKLDAINEKIAEYQTKIDSGAIKLEIPEGITADDLKNAAATLAEKAGWTIEEKYKETNPSWAAYLAVQFATEEISIADIQDFNNLKRKAAQLEQQINLWLSEMEKAKSRLAELPTEEKYKKAQLSLVANEVKEYADDLRQILANKNVDLPNSFSMSKSWKEIAQSIVARHRAGIDIFDNVLAKQIAKMHADTSAKALAVKFSEEELKQRLQIANADRLLMELHKVASSLNTLEQQLEGKDIPDHDIDVDNVKTELERTTAKLTHIKAYQNFLESTDYQRMRELEAMINRYKKLLVLLNQYYAAIVAVLDSVWEDVNEILSIFGFDFSLKGYDERGAVVIKEDGSIMPAINLSGGERALLAFAIMLALHKRFPKDVFLDEPFAAVDKQRIGLIEDVLDMYKTDSRFVIVTHHSMRPANATIYYVADGKILAGETPEEGE